MNHHRSVALIHAMGRGMNTVQLLASDEVIHLTSYPVELASGSHRVDGVVVGCASLDVLQSHPEHCIGMALIQPDMTPGRQFQVVRISPVLHQAKVLVRAARVVAGPPDNGFVVSARF